MDDDIDPAWRATPLPATPEPERPEPPPLRATAEATPLPVIRPPEPPKTEELKPPPEPPPAELETSPELEQGPEAGEEASPPASPAPLIGFVAVLLVLLGAVWHFTAPKRAYKSGLALLSQARRGHDAQKAAAALKALRPYVDGAGEGYEAVFEAALLAGDEATETAYLDRLLKSPPGGGSALLVWYETLLNYHGLALKSLLEAYDAADAPAAKLGVVEKIQAHLDAANALKPARARAVEDFTSGIPRADAGRLIRIDRAQAKIAEIDLADLRARADKTPAAMDAPAVSTTTAR